VSGIPGTYRSDACEVRASPIDGRGLFAARPIPAGDVIAIRGGHIVPKDVALRIDATLGGYSHPITDDFFLAPLDASEVPDVVAFFNHGCAPNIAPVGQIVFAASRDIAEGEEILCDYCTIVCYSEYRLDCRCGTPQCRGLVTGDDWRQPALRARYRGRFSTQIEQKITAEAGER
jgi:SET domain-containing protein